MGQIMYTEIYPITDGDFRRHARTASSDIFFLFIYIWDIYNLLQVSYK